MKIDAVFADYDGTLAPEDVPLKASRIPRVTLASLTKLSARIPVAIVTSKDEAFVRPRTPFAIAWACVSGLELVFQDGKAIERATKITLLEQALVVVKRRLPGVRLEVKRSSRGTILGFSADWRGSVTPPGLASITVELKKMGLVVEHDATRPYFDAFGSPHDKGEAVRDLRRLLKISGNVLFIGNSVADNPAFREADLPLCVGEGDQLEGISSRFAMPRTQLVPLLESLIEDGLSIDLRKLARR